MMKLTTLLVALFALVGVALGYNVNSMDRLGE